MNWALCSCFSGEALLLARGSDSGTLMKVMGCRMKKLLICLSAMIFAVNLLGCEPKLSEEEIKKGQEEMKQEEAQMSEELPAKLK